MKLRILLLVLLALVLFGQSSKKKPSQKSPDPEDRWICRIGSYHDCHCPAMWAERQEEYIKHCQTLGPGYDDCMKKMPSNCDLIQTADAKHPEHSCKRTCKTMAGCQCDDGPVCKGPIIYQPNTQSDEAN